MTTIERSWKEKHRGRTVTVTNKTIRDVDNPYIGVQLSDFENRANEEIDASWYALGYLIGEYGDDAIAEVQELSQEERDEYVAAIENHFADKNSGSPNPRAALDKVLEEADSDTDSDDGDATA